MQQQSPEKVVVSLNAYRERRERRQERENEEVKPGDTAAPIEKLAYYLLMAVRAAKELS